MITETDQIRELKLSEPIYAPFIGGEPAVLAYRVRDVLDPTLNHVENFYNMVTRVPEVVVREVSVQNFIPRYVQVRSRVANV